MFNQLLSSETIEARFSVSLVSGLLRSIIAFLTSMLLARWLGPEDFGRMVFLLASHIALRQFLDLGTSSAFFTFISQKKRSEFFILVYWYWLALQLALSVFLIWFILPSAFIESLWAGESRTVVVLALLASFTQGAVWQTAAQMAEASRETIRLQLIGALITLFHLLLVICLWFLGSLFIYIIFILIVLEWSFGSLIVSRLYRKKLTKNEAREGGLINLKNIFNEYKIYCIPLIPLAFLGFLHDFGDRWMLQTWGGSIEQAYFGVAIQIPSITLLATTAIIRIFWKEVAQAHEEKNYQRIGFLYKKLSRLLFFLGSMVASFLLPWSSLLIQLSAGDKYLAGSLTLSLMFFYPIHQSIGQLTNTMFYATSLTKILVYINSTFLILGLFMAFLVLAPQNVFILGLELGSQGLAWKLITMQVIFVNISSWVLAKKFSWKFEWSYQIVVLISLLTVSYSLFFLTSTILSEFSNLIQFSVFSALYFLLVACLVFKYPGISGLTANEISSYLKKLSFIKD